MGWKETSKWDDKYIQQATQLAKLGLSDVQIATVWGVTPDCLTKWKNNKPGFYEALQQGRIMSLGEVAESIFKIANGFYYEEETAVGYQGKVEIVTLKKYAKPNAYACVKILAVKDKEHWSEVQRSESVHTNINIAKLDLTSMTPEQLALIESIHKTQLTENVGNS
jgi:hypothetical protein